MPCLLQILNKYSRSTVTTLETHRWVSMRSIGPHTYLKFQCISFEVCIKEPVLFDSQANPVLLVLYLPLLIFYGLPAVTGNTLNQCCVFLTFWWGSGSADYEIRIWVRIRIWIRILLFSSLTFKTLIKNYGNFLKSFSAYYFLNVHIHHFSKINV